jgi:cell wall-associated NlpC family hydrolase
MPPSAGVSGRAVALASAGALLVYAGLRGESPLESLRGVLTGKPQPVPEGTPVTVSGASGGSLASGTAIVGSGAAASAVPIALAQVGKPYRWGGTGPNSFDCSGLIYYSYRKAGLQAPPRTSWGYAGSRLFRQVSRAQVSAGDVCWHPGHVALAISNTQVVEAPHAGVPVRTREISGFVIYYRYVGAGYTPKPAGP